jgi:hypothetical protein
MKKASEYRRHAEECRQLARSADSEEHRQLLSRMAATWDSLADERESKVQQTAERPAEEARSRPR